MLCDVVRRRRRWAHAPVIHAASHFDHKKRVAWVPTELNNVCARAKLRRQNSICRSFVLIFCSVSSMFCLSDLCQELNGFIVIVRFT